ncbi:MAG TPA: hypothetical protein VMW89_06845 [Desulfatiglandales bacterium]|nr:hypothetical protein [Desulfatiglandales bacterium]
MKKKILIIVAFTLCLVAPVHSAFAYGGGGETSGGDTSTGLRDANEPPEGFTSSEVPMGVDPTKNIRATGKITITPASDKTRSYEVDEAALNDGDIIVSGKHGATITWPNGATMKLKPNTKIQIIQGLKLPHADAVRVFYGNTWIKINYNEGSKTFEALTLNASTGRRG